MSLNGTAGYTGERNLPELVAGAVTAARQLDFPLCVRPEIGRLLAVLATGLPKDALVGETGTGTGAGLAWMVSAAAPDVRFISYEIDPDRAAMAQELFAAHPNVQVVRGDGGALFEHGPFDLLVHDGAPWAGKSPGDQVVDPTVVLRPGGTMTIDDYGPTFSWPPRFHGEVDAGRVHWFDHPDLRTSEINVARDLSVVVCRFLPPEELGADEEE